MKMFVPIVLKNRFWLRRSWSGALSLSLFLQPVAIGQTVAPAPGSTAPKANAGQPPASGRDPASQAERDWVDNRWSRTEVGQFLASNLQAAGVRVAKGLSIRVGTNDDAAVGYDTGACALRAGWLGGFLRFDPARFGLMGAPAPAGRLMWGGQPSLGWVGTSNRYSGLHLHGKRVVLDYLVDGVRVLESPWFEGETNAPTFTRSFELAPHAAELTLAVGSLPGNSEKAAPGSRRSFADETTTLRSSDASFRLALGGAKAELEQRADGLVVLHFAPSPSPRRFRVAFSLANDKSSPTSFDAANKPVVVVEDLAELIRPGPAHWLPELSTIGQRGLDTDIFAVDTLTVPYNNPWRALFFLAGVDFTGPDTAYVCTIHGDVWRVTGIDPSLRALRWKRFATGLFQPLGLKVRDGEVFVLGRDQITRLHDQDADGEADFYENFCNLIQTSTGGHEYVTSLEEDDAGNFYYVDPRGAHRVSRDGQTLDRLASGFRNPNGLGVSPDGRLITVAPQQGEWTPSSEICLIHPGAYYGYGGPKITPERPGGYDPPLCWIPHRVDNSSGSQVWVPQDLWGPFGGQLLHLLWGRCGVMLVVRDAAGQNDQGGVVPLPIRLLSGPHRGTFHRHDGHLYLAGSTGWQTSAVKDGALQRVRYTGKPVRLPMAWHAHSNGLTLTFTQPLERSAAEDPGSYAVSQWNYRYAAQYGSKDWSVANPAEEGRDSVTVRSARLLPDGRSVFLETDPLRPVMQMEIQYSLNTTDGVPMKNQLWLTLNSLDVAR